MSRHGVLSGKPCSLTFGSPPPPPPPPAPGSSSKRVQGWAEKVMSALRRARVRRGMRFPLSGVVGPWRASGRKVDVVRAGEPLALETENGTDLSVLVGDDDLSVVDRTSSAVRLAHGLRHKIVDPFESLLVDDLARVVVSGDQLDEAVTARVDRGEVPLVVALGGRDHAERAVVLALQLPHGVRELRHVVGHFAHRMGTGELEVRLHE